MKYDIGEKRPGHFKEYWPGMYHCFSHYEYVSNVPQVLFLITTINENGKTNACLHSWSAFSGDSGGFFAVLTGLMQNTHTYKNILRDKEFCINFLSAKYYEECQKTIKCNDEDVDEVIFSGLNIEKSSIVNPPRIKEAFLSYECKLHNHDDLSGKGISAMIVGRVVNAVIEGSHDKPEELCGEKSFMYYIHAPKNPETGEGAEAGIIAALKSVRPD